MFVFDAHLDLALNGVDWNRDLRQEVDDIRVQEISLGMTNELGRGTNTLSFSELRRAGIGLCLTTLLARQEKEINHPMGWTSPETCYAMAHAHLAYYRAMERAGYLKMLKTSGQLQEHFQYYKAHPQTAPLGFVLTMEGADPVLTPETIFEFHELGLRAIGLTHYGANRYGGGTRTEVGLTANAIPLLKNIADLGMTVDVTHLSDVAFWQLLDLFPGKIHASHQNLRRICNWQRQFSDEQVKAVIDRGGVLGLALDVIMIQKAFVRGKSKPEATISDAIENIDAICQIAGNAKHVGIGSDLDGGYGYEQTPSDLNKISDIQKIPDLLSKRGYSREDIEGIMYGNWLRFFTEALPKK